MKAHHPDRLRALARSLLPLLTVPPMIAQGGGGLPEVTPPTGGTDGGILKTVQNYSHDIVLLVALLVISAMFLGVAYHAYTSYSEIHTGRRTWGEFGLTVSVGALLLVLAIWLLTQATGVL